MTDQATNDVAADYLRAASEVLRQAYDNRGIQTKVSADEVALTLIVRRGQDNDHLIKTLLAVHGGVVAT